MESTFEAIDRQIAKTLCRLHVKNEDLEATYARLSQACRHGNICLEVSHPSKELLSCPHTVYDAPRLYFKKYWDMETRLLEGICQVLERPVNPLPNDYVARLDAFVSQGVLLPEQAGAVSILADRGLLIISGGPGTGKSYTAGHCIASLLGSLDKFTRPYFSVFCCAPTGKAAARLQESLTYALNNAGIESNLQATTLHRLFDIVPCRTQSTYNHYLSADLILVDEGSMIDADMMARLFSSLKPGARLILMGDGDQLPPVESGFFFHELCQLDGVASTRLGRCLRTELKSIVAAATACRKGDPEAFFAALEHLTYEEGSLSRAIPSIVSRYCSLLKGDSEQVLANMAKFRVLTPLRQGPFGVRHLNRVIKESLPNDIPVPIMISSNAPKFGLYNGDLGVMIGKQGFFSQKVLPRALLPKYEYAYCLSVHKSQGSEFDEVLVLAPTGTENFSREIIYTAVTRARRSLAVWGKRSTLEDCLQLPCQRLSGLGTRFEKRFAKNRVIV